MLRQCFGTRSTQIPCKSQLMFLASVRRNRARNEREALGAAPGCVDNASTRDSAGACVRHAD